GVEVEAIVESADGDGLNQGRGQTAAAGHDRVRARVDLDAVAAGGEGHDRTDAWNGDGDAAQPLADVIAAAAVAIDIDDAGEEGAGVASGASVDGVVVLVVAGAAQDDTNADLRLNLV